MRPGAKQSPADQAEVGEGGRATRSSNLRHIAQLPPAPSQLRSQVALSRLLAVLGPSLLSARWLPLTSAGDVLDVVIWDAVDEPNVSPGDLVLGVGVRDEASVISLLKHLGPKHPAGLVIKMDTSPSLSLPQVLHEAAEESAVPLIQLTSGASWEQIVVLVRSLLVQGSQYLDSQGTGSSAMNDLFGLADVVGAVLGAPVTIEDRSSRVLAFSGRQGGVDQARSETILGRRVPERYTQLLEERGIFRRLLNDTAPVYVERLTEDMMPRVAVTVRASDEVLGSIWAAIEEPLSPERQEWLADAAQLVALHLLRLRAEADIGQRLRAEVLASLLKGGDPSLETASRLGLAPGPSCVVAAVPCERTPASVEADRQRLVTSLSVHLMAVRPRSAVARIGDVVYAVISPVDEFDREGHGPRRLLQEFLDYTDQGQKFLIGVGRPVDAFNDLVRSRADADKALRVLRQCSLGRQIVQFSDVQLESLLIRLGDIVADDGDLVLGPIDDLVSYDKRHNAGLVDTLIAYLDAFGDVAAASAAVHVHPNTFRYRLRRLSAISGVDLSDPGARFTVMLQLRLREIALQNGTPSA